MNCPLCENFEINCIHADPVFFGGMRGFYQCASCQLIFVPEKYHISLAEEKERYELHENSPEDLAYIAFLNQLIEPFKAHIAPNSKGIDYGCGPGPAIKHILRDSTLEVEEYDPHFKPDSQLLNKQYDFLIATEVIEHFRNPQIDFAKINDLVRVGGVIGLMTSIVTDKVDFPGWGYKNDPTHLMFYAKETFEKIASIYDWQLLEITERVIIFEK